MSRAAAGAGAGVLAVVPVSHDDRSPPVGAAALWPLRDVPLVRRAVGALLRSRVCDVVVVATPAALVLPVTDLLATLPASPDITVHVVAVPGPGHGHGLLAALKAASALGRGAGPDDVVVVHDPLHALAPASLVRGVVEALAAAGPTCAGAVPVRPVTDTLKCVDADDVVLRTVDREGFRMVCSPQAHRREPLVDALLTAGEDHLRAAGADVVPRLVQRRGGRLVSVPAPGEVFRIATDDDLVLAEAMLHVGADLDDETAARQRPLR